MKLNKLFSGVTKLVAFVVIFVNLVPYGPTDGYFMFGESCSLSGVSAAMGEHISRGVWAAFDEINRRGGLAPLGTTLNITLKDDMYEPDLCVNNTLEFLNDPSIFALIGYVGTPTTHSVKEFFTTERTPLIGSLTGDIGLRVPFLEYFITSRATYNDEAAAMVDYLVRKKFFFRVAILFQNDSYGYSARNGVLESMGPYNLDFVAEATYTRNSLDEIDYDLIRSVHDSAPEAIILAGVSQPNAKFIHLYEQLYGNESVTYLSFSIGPVATALRVEEFGTDLKDTNVIFMEVVPNISDEKFKIVRDAKEALGYHGHDLTFKSLEGYIIGRIVIEAMQKMNGEISREGFMKVIYDVYREFLISDLIIGEYYRNDTILGSCNQGMSRVWPVRIVNSSYFVTVEEAEYSWKGQCLAPETSQAALFLSQTCPLSGPNSWSGKAYESGMKTSGFEYIRELDASERIVALTTLDDQSDPIIASQNIDFFLDQNRTFLIFGGMDIDNALRYVNITEPFFAPYSGSNRFRDPETSNNVVNIRAGYDEEIGEIIQHALELGKTRISVLYDIGTSSVGLECFSLVEEILSNIDMKIYSNSSFDPSNEELSIEEATEEILHSYNGVLLPEVIIMFGKYEPLTRFIKLVINEPQVQQQIQEQQESESDDIMIKFATVSTVGTIPFLNQLQNVELISEHLVYENIWISQVVPNFNDSSIPIVADYQFFMKELGLWDEFAGYISFEGYIAGRLVTSVLSTFSNDELSTITSQEFLDRVNSLKTIFLGEEFDDRTLQLGPYNIDDPDPDFFCNQGLRSAWLTSLSDGQVSDRTSISTSTSTTCRYTMVPKFPTFFGQSVGMNEKTRVYTQGIRLAFEEHFGMTGPSILILLDKDSYDNQTIQNSHLVEFAQKNVMALVGGSEFDHNDEEEEDIVKSFLEENNIIMIDPNNNNVFGGNPEDSRVIHLRPFTIDEIYYANDYYYNELKKNFGVLFFSSEDSEKYDQLEHLELMNIPTIITGSTENQIFSSFSSDLEVVMYLPDDDLQFLRDTLIPELLESPDYPTVDSLPEFVFPSYVYGGDLKNLSETYNHQIRYSTISLFSRTSISYNNFRDNYESEYFPEDGIDFGFHGYLVGKWIVSNYISSVNHEQTFFDNIHKQDSFDIENDVIIRFGGPECNIGIKTLLFYDHLGDELAIQELRGCTEYYEWQPDEVINPPEDGKDVITIFGVVFPTVLVCIIVLFFCFCLFVCSLACVVTFFLWCVLSCGVVVMFIIGQSEMKNRRKSKKLGKLLKYEGRLTLLESIDVFKNSTFRKSFEEIRKELETRGTLIEYSELKLDKERTKMLGGGGSGANVILVYWKTRKMFVAFKQFKISDLLLSENIKMEVLNEVSIMSNLDDHKYILKYYGTVIDTKVQVVGHLLEYCEQGDLRKYLYNDTKQVKLSVYKKLDIIRCIADAMEYLHDKGNIMHRDLKLENVLMTKDGVVKVMDFGISRKIDATKLTKCGTNCYIAPEITRGEDYTSKCDVYSFGILLIRIR